LNSNTKDNLTAECAEIAEKTTKEKDVRKAALQAEKHRDNKRSQIRISWVENGY
jgi:hypothetical protein